MIVPNADRAIVDIRKLRDYCLDPEHDDGKHKARLFKAAFGITASDAADLRDALLQIVRTHDAKLGRRDGYGQRYVVDFVFEWRGRRAVVRSAWIIEHDADPPRLTSCYPL
ncbi:MAG: hypothetical protein HZC40_19370 [Chloroflexi bacterium]|nr:hypothetical protein [Chloroflexota bacterium]